MDGNPVAPLPSSGDFVNSNLSTSSSTEKTKAPRGSADLSFLFKRKSPEDPPVTPEHASDIYVLSHLLITSENFKFYQFVTTLQMNMQADIELLLHSGDEHQCRVLLSQLLNRCKQLMDLYKEDLIIISTSFFVILFGSDGNIFGAQAIRGIRFVQILRMLHIDREGGCWRLLGSVIMEHKQEMFTALYIGFLGLVFSSYFMFLIEKDAIVNNIPSTQFDTYADALWWGVVTMMTIGYGDKVPLTWSGRLLACASALFTVSFFALPAGILGSGFALKVQQQQRQKHFSRQIPAAATLIQTLWRCYAADKNFTSIATWKIHLRSVSNSTNKYNKTMAALRRRRPKYKTEVDKNDQNERKTYGEIAVTLEAPKSGLHQSRSVPDMMISMHDDLMKKDGSPTSKLQGLFSPDDYQSDSAFDDEIDSRCLTQLSEAHKNAIRALRKIKYFVAKRKFQQARKPYDVGDVIEQYSQGQIGMNVRLKELHRRMDQMLGKSGSQLLGKNGKPVTLGEKLQQMDQQMQVMDRKIDSISYAVHTIARELQKSMKPEKQITVSS